ncbi:type II toxin-antitoxin system RelE/ParE family toxin (plasmid) [Rhizobium sp. 32-5/1]|uniref:type II toxin-antitoxin system RelE/ParE family toxin n=1 Tax=Rhizobium sp. 32-5/1 TaxID=3019602 RepID=UPI00240CF0E1|nr:type II toxin-antitoxin system RelE/ParE family toxin [Rhizobium sp. 32-5/1]WEZ86108.1 type II toxin-antitoxin system RelE/ParE family toxin [Rhizobium sp. 32-5/1]
MEYGVTDAMLCVAAKEIEAGLVGFLLKTRVAAPGRGKSGNYRTIVGHRQADRLIFVHGFAKNKIDSIKKNEKAALRKLCDVYMGADDKKLAEMIKKNTIRKIECNEPDTGERT